MRKLASRILASFVGAWIVGLGVTGGLVIAAEADPSRVPGLQTIKTTGALARMPDGRLMTWWREGEKGEQRAFARFSEDEGRTWSTSRHLFDFPKQEGNYGTGYVNLVDKDGAIHLFGLHYIGTGPDGFYDWENAKSFIYHVMSSDNGQTWTRAQYCDFGYLYTGAVNSAIQLKSGRILVPLSYYSKRKTGKFVSNLTLSDDGGNTWRPSTGQCAIDSGGHLLEAGANEPVCVELEDGRVWMLMRTQTGYQHESFSEDGGDTWTEPVPSRFVSSNSPGFLLRLRDGRLIFVWNNCMSPYSQGNILTSYDRQILAAAVSNDDGQTWHGYREIVRVKEAHQAVAYPFLTETKGDAFFCSKGNRPVRVPVDWLMEKSITETFENGLANWMTIGCEGAEIVPHPDNPNTNVMRLRKPKKEIPAAASLNFPFGIRGDMTLRVQLKPDPRWPHRQHCYLCLTDFFSMPRLPVVIKGNPPGGWGVFPEGGRFKIRIAPDGEIGVATRPGLFQDEFRRTQAALKPGMWHILGLKWDCEKGTCVVTLDGNHVADLMQLSRAVGICYLRLWMSAVAPEFEGLLVESVQVNVEP